MGCTGRYAEAWEFASFWCIGSLLRRVDNGVGNGRAYLEDLNTDFEAAGVEAGSGMVLYNLTDGSSGEVTAVTTNRLTATLLGGTENLWDSGDRYRIVLIDVREIAIIESVLDITAGDLHGVLAASGACNCTLAAWAPGLLKKLNIIEAASFYQCECAKPNLSDDARLSLRDWSERQLELIRTGKLELCAGSTGSEFPAVDWAEQGVNEFSQAQIIENSE